MVFRFHLHSGAAIDVVTDKSSTVQDLVERLAAAESENGAPLNVFFNKPTDNAGDPASICILPGAVAAIEARS